MDTRSLGVFRILLGATLLWDLAIPLQDIRAFYSNEGVLPLQSLLELQKYQWAALCPHLWNGSPLYEALLFALAAAAAVCLTIGWKTRGSLVLCWVLLISKHHRNPLILIGSDSILSLMLFWGFFLPLDRAFSLDRRLAKTAKQPLGRFFSWGSAAYLAQIVMLYESAFIFKIRNPAWQQGWGVYYSLSKNIHQTPLGQWLLGHLTAVHALSPLVLGFELVGPILLFFPWRNALWRSAGIVGFWLLHLGLGLGLWLDLFPWVSILCMAPFVPSEWWEPRSFFKPTLATEVFPESRAKKLAIGFFLLYILSFNVLAFSPFGLLLPVKVENFGNLLDLRQGWSMFTFGQKDGKVWDDWLVVPARLEDGSFIDAVNGNKLSWRKPRLMPSRFKNARWLKWFSTMRKNVPRDRLLARSTALFLCRENPRIRSMRFVSLWNRIFSPDTPKETPRIYARTLLEYSCGE